MNFCNVCFGWPQWLGKKGKQMVLVAASQEPVIIAILDREFLWKKSLCLQAKRFPDLKEIISQAFTPWIAFWKREHFPKKDLFGKMKWLGSSRIHFLFPTWEAFQVGIIVSYELQKHKTKHILLSIHFFWTEISI